MSDRYSAIPNIPFPESVAKQPAMLTTITLAGRTLAQGIAVATLPDGRVVISTGRLRLTGWPIRPFRAAESETQS